MKILEKNVSAGLLVLRLSIGVMMLLHGVAKLIYGIDPIAQMVVAAGLPSFVAYGVYIGEFVAPLFIIAGFGTRVAAAIFAFNMLVATLLAHGGQIFQLDAMGGWAIELQGLFFFAALALVFTGGGKYALSTKNIWD